MRIKKRDKILLLLFVIIAILGIGYAYLNSNLTILGNSQIKNANWDIHWANAQVLDFGVPATNGPNIDNDGTRLSFSTTLSKPGDMFYMVVDAVNGGTIDGIIGNFGFKLNGESIYSLLDLPSYMIVGISYIDGNSILIDDLLEAGEFRRIALTIGYNPEVDARDLPEEDQLISFEVTGTFNQSDDNAISSSKIVYTSSEEIIYRLNSIMRVDLYCDKEISTGNYYNCFETIGECEDFLVSNNYSETDICEYKTTGITSKMYDSYQELIEDTNKRVFLRHQIFNDTVNSSQIGFTYNDNKAHYVLDKVYIPYYHYAHNIIYHSSTTANKPTVPFSKTSGSRSYSSDEDVFYKVNKNNLHYLLGSLCHEYENPDENHLYYCADEDNDFEVFIVEQDLQMMVYQNSWACTNIIDGSGVTCSAARFPGRDFIIEGDYYEV